MFTAVLPEVIVFEAKVVGYLFSAALLCMQKYWFLATCLKMGFELPSNLVLETCLQQRNTFLYLIYVYLFSLIQTVLYELFLNTVYGP